MGKLILACLAKSKYDDAFGAFRRDRRRQQPAAPVCTALVRVCACAAAGTIVLCRLPLDGRRRMALPAPAAPASSALLKTGTAEQVRPSTKPAKTTPPPTTAPEWQRSPRRTRPPPPPPRLRPRSDARRAHARGAREEPPGRSRRALAALAALDKAGGEPPSAAALAASHGLLPHASRRARSSSSAASAATSTRSRKSCSTPSPSPSVTPSTPPPAAAPRRRVAPEDAHPADQSTEGRARGTAPTSRWRRRYCVARAGTSRPEEF